MLDDILKLFAERTQLFDSERNSFGLEDALTNLLLWMDMSRDKLDDEDWSTLGTIGGLMQREVLRQRQVYNKRS